MNLRYFVSAAMFQFVGGLMILVGLVVLVITQLMETSAARLGFIVGFPLAIVGGALIAIGNLKRPTRHG